MIFKVKVLDSRTDTVVATGEIEVDQKEMPGPYWSYIFGEVPLVVEVRKDESDIQPGS